MVGGFTAEQILCVITTTKHARVSVRTFSVTKLLLQKNSWHQKKNGIFVLFVLQNVRESAVATVSQLLSINATGESEENNATLGWVKLDRHWNRHQLSACNSEKFYILTNRWITFGLRRKQARILNSFCWFGDSDDDLVVYFVSSLTLTLGQLSVNLSQTQHSTPLVQPNLVVQSAQIPPQHTQGVQFTSLLGQCHFSSKTESSRDHLFQNSNRTKVATNS